MPTDMTNALERHKYDVLVIGAGGAGLRAAVVAPREGDSLEPRLLAEPAVLVEGEKGGNAPWLLWMVIAPAMRTGN